MTRPEHDAIPEAARAFVAEGKGAVLATVIRTWGSAPRPVGSQLAVSGDGVMVGSVSGGCVEGAVVYEAEEALKDGRCRVLDFGVSDDDAFAVGLACGGEISVMVEPVGVGQGLPVAMLDDLIAARADRRACALITDVATWERRLSDHADGQEADRIEDGFLSDKSSLQDQSFVHIHNPPLRLVVVGAVHIAQPLVQMAGLCGYDVTLVDPRGSFGNADRFPGQTISDDWPDEALAAIGLDARSAVVTLTHDPKLDDPAIMAALASPVFYLGCLGSTRTHGKRLDRLAAQGLTPKQLARIDAPVGLDIGAKSPAEIAVSIMGELTERLRQPESRK